MYYTAAGSALCECIALRLPRAPPAPFQRRRWRAATPKRGSTTKGAGTAQGAGMRRRSSRSK